MLLLSCSCQKQDGQVELKSFEEKFKSDEKKCREQESLLLSVLIEGKTDFEFITDEPRVLEILAKFNVELTSEERRLAFEELSYKFCKNEQKSFPFSCPSAEVMIYMRSLIEGAKINKWSASTKTLAIDAVTNYIRFQNTQRHDLLSIRSLIEVYDLLLKNKLLNKDISSEIERALLEIASLSKTKKKLDFNNCKQLTQDYQIEIKETKQFLQKSIEWEKVLPTGP